MKRAFSFGVAASAIATVGLYALRGRRWQRCWGATDEEVERAMPGDDLVANPNYRTTRAITIDAPPGDIYPWLLQMGYHRGGLYSYDWLDRLFGVLDAPSARAIIPALQRLEFGDEIPVGKGGAFPVCELEQDRVFVLGDAAVGWSWATCLYPVDAGRTRLVTRNHGAFPDGLRWWLQRVPFDLAAFLMVRRWLIVLKERAEGLRQQREAAAPGPDDRATDAASGS